MIALKYLLFAIISTAVNLAFQHISYLIYAGVGNLYIAMFAGTAAGLVCKYVLDKKFIFYHTPADNKQDAKKFMAYTLTGVVTTIIFWGTEIAFDTIYGTETARYVGAVIGLSIGYISKYFLDKKYVFTEQTT